MKKIILPLLMALGLTSQASGAMYINGRTQTMLEKMSNNLKTCSYIKSPDILLGRMIDKIKREKRTEDLFCDRDGMKMAYYLIEDENYNLTIGIAIPINMSTTNSQFKNIFLKKLDDYKIFFKTLDKKNLGNTPLPDKEIIRFYGQVSGTDKFFIIGKYVNDLNTNSQKMIVSNHGKDFFDKIKLFEGINVEYSDEIVF